MNAPSPTPLLRCSNVDVTFKQRHTKEPFFAVRGASIDVGHGEIVGLVGESGSGKSTLARAIVGLEATAGGSIEFDGELLGLRRPLATRRGIQMIFQDPYGSLDPRMTIGATLREMLRKHTDLRRSAMQSRCRELMDMVQLPSSILANKPAGMSGGQRQRVAIARALAISPRLLVADEAVSALDVSVQAGVINLLADLRQELGLSILFISHDLAIVRTLCDRVSVIYLGEIVETQDCADLFEHPESTYTQELLSAIPRLDGDRSGGLIDGVSF